MSTWDRARSDSTAANLHSHLPEDLEGSTGEVTSIAGEPLAPGAMGHAHSDLVALAGRLRNLPEKRAVHGARGAGRVRGQVGSSSRRGLDPLQCWLRGPLTPLASGPGSGSHPFNLKMIQVRRPQSAPCQGEPSGMLFLTSWPFTHTARLPGSTASPQHVFWGAQLPRSTLSREHVFPASRLQGALFPRSTFSGEHGFPSAHPPGSTVSPQHFFGEHGFPRHAAWADSL